MLSEKATAALDDILYNIVAAQTFLRDLSFEAFKDDLKTLYATPRALEIVCEATRRLPDELKDRCPEVAWAGHPRCRQLLSAQL